MLLSPGSSAIIDELPAGCPDRLTPSQVQILSSRPTLNPLRVIFRGFYIYMSKKVLVHI